MTTLDKVLKDMEKLKHEKFFYEAMNEFHVKMIDRQDERIQEFTELISTLKMRKEELEKDNELLKDTLGFNSDYLLELMELKERQIKELREENYKIKKRCNNLVYSLAEASNYCDSVLNDDEDEEKE